jgi:hypothetical protein
LALPKIFSIITVAVGVFESDLLNEPVELAVVLFVFVFPLLVFPVTFIGFLRDSAVLIHLLGAGRKDVVDFVDFGLLNGDDIAFIECVVVVPAIVEFVGVRVAVHVLRLSRGVVDVFVQV